MSYYEIQDVAGTDFICTVKDHTRRSVSKLLVKAHSEAAARLSFRGERSMSVISVTKA